MKYNTQNMKNIGNKIKEGLKWEWNHLNSSEPKEFFVGSLVLIVSAIVIARIIGWLL